MLAGEKNAHKHTNTLTSARDEFVLQAVIGLFGHLVSGTVLDIVLIQEVADLLDPLQEVVVVFIHQTLDPAARRAFKALMEDGTEGEG